MSGPRMTRSRIASDRIQINLTPEQRTKLQDIARRQDRPVAEVVRDLIEREWVGLFSAYSKATGT